MFCVGSDGHGGMTFPAFKFYYMKRSYHPPGNADLIFLRLLSFIFSVKRREVICRVQGCDNVQGLMP